jgi:hypothetical protein
MDLVASPLKKRNQNPNTNVLDERVEAVKCLGSA